jgi:serine/threonine-protein kinase
VVVQTTAETGATTIVQTVTEEEEEPPAPKTVEVPDVSGIGHEDAGATIEALGLKADTYPVESAEERGTVVSQDPAAGEQAQTGDTVRLNVALGSGPREQVDVPDVTGPKESDARAAARAANLTVRTVDRDAPSAEEVGEVLTQEPSAGAAVPELTQITLFVGR